MRPTTGAQMTVWETLPTPGRIPTPENAPRAYHTVLSTEVPQSNANHPARRKRMSTKVQRRTFIVGAASLAITAALPQPAEARFQTVYSYEPPAKPSGEMGRLARMRFEIVADRHRAAVSSLRREPTADAISRAEARLMKVCGYVPWCHADGDAKAAYISAWVDAGGVLEARHWTAITETVGRYELTGYARA